MVIPEILDKCVEKLKAKGKSEKSAFAICTASLKKAGKLDDQMIEELSKIEEGSAEFKELETYLQENNPKKKQKKESTKEPYHRFSYPISESFIDSIQFSEKESSIDIQCLRMGKFRHPWYGTLNFDEKFFDNIIKNFEADLPNPELAFDFKHQPDYGAAAWINKFFKEEKSLMANVTLTKRGKEALKNKEFRYFSIEYTDDYVEYEFKEEESEKGVLVEKETRISYGPTALGGGLTNRPFIKGMLPVSLTETGEIIEFEEINDEQFSKEVKESMDKTLEEMREEQKKIQDRIKELEDKGEKASKEELTSLIAKLDDISAEVKKLSEKDGDDEETTKTLEELNDTKKQLQDATDALKKKDAEVTKLSEDVRALSDTVTKLMESNKTLQEDKYRISVEKKLSDFQKLGAFPSTLKVIKSVALSSEARNFSVKLSEGEGESKKEVQKGFLDVVEEVLSSIPEDHRFTEEELSISPRTATGSPKELSVEDAEKYAKDKGISFEDALIELSKEGKIQ